MQSTETGDEATRPDKARPEFAALATRAASLAPERFYSPSAVLIRDLLAALAAERDRADRAEARLTEAKRQGQASALRQVSNAVRNPDELMGLSWPELSDRLRAEAERLDPVAEARARAVAEATA